MDMYMNTYQVIMTRFVSPEEGNVLESIPAIRADYFTTESITSGEFGNSVLAKFWTKEGDEKDHALTAVVLGFLAIIRTGEERNDQTHPLGDSYPTA